MRRYALPALVLLAVAGAAGWFFYRTEAPPTESAAPARPAVELGGVSLRIDLATTTAVQERGLGGRSVIPDGYGMLFVFPKDGLYGFWMKDMLVPIDIFWLDAKGQVVSVVSDADPASYPSVFYPAAPARFVLETAAGFARAHAIATGTLASLKNIPAVSQ